MTDNTPQLAPSPETVNHILIIGAGIAGLALAIGCRSAKYEVTVIERDSGLHEIGAGIQLPTNSIRILRKMGALDEVLEYCTEPQSLIIHSYHGKDLSTQVLSPVIEREFGQPHLLIHRADLRKGLYDKAIAVGVTIRFGCCMEKLDFESMTAMLSSGAHVRADLMVGADGEHSASRVALLDRSRNPWSSGDVVFRVTLNLKDLETDPELKSLVDPPGVHAWYGPGSHAVCYPLTKRGVFNMVLTLPEDKGAATTGPQPANLAELRWACRSWDSRIQRLLFMAETALKWTLLESEVLERWHHPNGRFVLLGDAAHATLPYLAQGAALAVESSYILSRLLERQPPASILPNLMAAFTSSRLPRTAAVRARSKRMHDVSQLPDGPEQAERDKILQAGKPASGFPNPWADPEWSEFMWGYDARLEADRIWRQCSG